MLMAHHFSPLLRQVSPSLFLAACAVCHKIKDDEGNWRPPEDFADQREAGAVFTHTICRSCLKVSYPEFWDSYSQLLTGKKNGSKKNHR